MIDSIILTAVCGMRFDMLYAGGNYIPVYNFDGQWHIRKEHVYGVLLAVIAAEKCTGR